LFLKKFTNDFIPILRYLTLLFLPLSEPIFCIGILVVSNDITSSFSCPGIFEPKLAYTMDKLTCSEVSSINIYCKQIAEKLHHSPEIKVLTLNHNPKYYSVESERSGIHYGVKVQNYVKYTSIENPELVAFATNNINRPDILAAHFKHKTLHL